MYSTGPRITSLLASAYAADCGLRGLSAAGCARALGVDGVTISVLHQAGLELFWHDPADRAGIALDDLQCTVGEGPTWDAARLGTTVLVPDVHAAEGRRWTALETQEWDVISAVVALPLRSGTLPIGALTAHREAAPFTPIQLAGLAVLASGAVRLVLSSGSLLDMQATPSLLAPHRALIHQAAGMLSVQFGGGTADAMARLRAYSFAQGRPLHHVAHDVAHNRLNIDD